MTALGVIIACGLLAIVYGIWAIWSVMQADPGSARMQEIAAAVREGAQAYLKRQYTTIAMVGVVIFLIVGYLLGWLVGLGFLIGPPREPRSPWSTRSSSNHSQRFRSGPDRSRSTTSLGNVGLDGCRPPTCSATPMNESSR